MQKEKNIIGSVFSILGKIFLSLIAYLMASSILIPHIFGENPQGSFVTLVVVTHWGIILFIPVFWVSILIGKNSRN